MGEMVSNPMWDVPIQEGMTTAEMQELFEVQGFALGLCVVRRRSDGKLGTLDFDHAPRLYYNFVEA